MTDFSSIPAPEMEELIKDAYLGRDFEIKHTVSRLFFIKSALLVLEAVAICLTSYFIYVYTHTSDSSQGFSLVPFYVMLSCGMFRAFLHGILDYLNEPPKRRNDALLNLIPCCVYGIAYFIIAFFTLYENTFYLIPLSAFVLADVYMVLLSRRLSELVARGETVLKRLSDSSYIKDAAEEMYHSGEVRDFAARLVIRLSVSGQDEASRIEPDDGAIHVYVFDMEVLERMG